MKHGLSVAVFLVGSWAWAAVPSWAAVPGEWPGEEIRQIAAEAGERRPWVNCDDELEAAADQLRCALRGSEPLSLVAPRFAEAWNLNQGATHALIEGLLWLDRASEMDDPAAVELLADTVALGRTRLRQAAALAPGSRLVALERAAFLDERASGDGSDAAALMELLQAAPTEWQLFEALRHRTGFGSRARVVALWLEEAPEHPVLLAELAEVLAHKPRKAALLSWALELTDDGAFGASPAARALLAQRTSRVLLEMGLTGEALALYDGLEPGARDRITGGDRTPVREVVGGIALAGELEDQRAWWVTALWAGGRLDEAVALHAAMDPPPPPSPGRDPEVSRQLEDLERTADWVEHRWLAAALDAEMGGEVEDPFGLLMEAVPVDLFRPDSAGGAAFAAVPAIAEAAGFPSIQHFALSQRCLRLGYPETDWALRSEWGTEVAERLRTWPAVRDRAARFEALNRRARQEIGDAMRLLGPVPGAARSADCRVDPPAAAAERSSLAGIPLDRIEVDLPSDDRSWDRNLDGGAALHRALGLPETFSLRTLVQDEAEMVAVGWHESLMGVQGIWVLHSVDGGVTWSAPLYTGIGPSQRVSVLPASSRHRLDGDRLVLEVVLWKQARNRLRLTSDEDSFQQGLIHLSLEELRRDRDGDGLGDAEERWLRTDPRRADTDGDGLDDAVDPLPSQGEPSTASADRQRAFNLVLASMLGGAPSDDTLSPFLPLTKPLTERAAVLLADDGLPVGGEPLPVPIGLVPPGDPALTDTDRWVDSGIREVILFELDHAEERGVAAWRGRSNGRVWLKKVEGRWYRDGGSVNFGGCVVHRLESEVPAARAPDDAAPAAGPPKAARPRR